MRFKNIPSENKVHYKNYLLLLVICLLAFWPLTFNLFSVKNDAIHYFLPYRFNISEAIRNGEWPFWSPYIYLGYPVYGDMQSGAWNPIVLLTSLFSRYDVTIFQYENLLYIFLAGIGMYKLTNHFIKHTQTALLIAVSYMLSGFMASGQLINWLASAAFIPFVILYYLRIKSSITYYNAIKTGIALYFLFTAGYPSFFIITCYLLIILFLTRFIETQKIGKESNKWRRFFLNHIILVFVFTGFSLPAIVSYIDLLPFYQRGEGIQYADAIKNSFEWKHLLTLIFPSATKVSDVSSATDVTLRNIYIGILPIIILLSFPPKITKRNVFLIFLAIFALLFSLGDATPVRKICYSIIPLMDTFRHPSQMRLFFILSLLLLSAPGLQKVITNNLSNIEWRKLKLFTISIMALIFVVTVTSFSKSSIESLSFSGGSNEFIKQLKNFIDSITVFDALSINGTLQVLFIALFLIWIFKWKQNKNILVLIWVANLFLFIQFILPVTFVSKTSAGEINQFIHASPKGFPVAGLENTIKENSRDATKNFETAGLSYFYNKKIGISPVTNSPSFLTEQEEFLNSPFLYAHVSSLPVIYLADTTILIQDTLSSSLNNYHSVAFTNEPIAQHINYSKNDKAKLISLSSNKFEIEIKSDSPGFLVLTQNFHPEWQVTIDGRKEKIYKTNSSFMGCIIPKGKHEVIFKFSPWNTLLALYIQSGIIIALVILFIISFYKGNKRFLHN